MDVAAALHAGFASAAPEFFGAAEAALAQPGGPVTAKVFIDQDTGRMGDVVDVAGSVFLITVLRQGGAAPAVGLVLTVGARSFRLERRVGETSDTTTWEAARV